MAKKSQELSTLWEGRATFFKLENFDHPIGCLPEFCAVVGSQVVAVDAMSLTSTKVEAFIGMRNVPCTLQGDRVVNLPIMIHVDRNDL